jgi:hypothetical protein
MADLANSVRPETAFDPECVQVLASALDDAWERIKQSGSQFARPAYSHAMREVIAKRIIEMAQRGIKDRQKLADGAVRFLAANYRDNITSRVPVLRNAAEGCGEKQSSSASAALELP